MITGLCRAYTDYIISLSTAELEALGYKKGCDDEISKQTLAHIIQTKKGQWLPGGPISNSMATIAYLGGKTGFIGKTANDEAGAVFRDAFTEHDVVYKTPPAETEDGFCSGVVICLVTQEDAERSFIFNKGVVDKITLSDIDANQDLLAQTDTLFISHFFKSEDLTHCVLYALEKAPKAKLATSLQSMNFEHDDKTQVCRRHIRYGDIIFGNRREWSDVLSHNGISSIQALTDQYPKRIYVETMGEGGAVIYKGKEKIYVPSQSPEKIVDTTGAGDGFAGGFLYALEQGKSLRECGQAGAAAAAHILMHYGGRPVPAEQEKGSISV